MKNIAKKILVVLLITMFSINLFSEPSNKQQTQQMQQNNTSASELNQQEALQKGNEGCNTTGGNIALFGLLIFIATAGNRRI
jgi:hypothetical protein